MKKILLITSSFIEQDSVSSITRNIISSYQLIPDSELIVAESEKILNIPLVIKPEFIIVAHPSVVTNPDFPEFLTNELDINTTLVIYIFGDYVRKAPFYLKLDKILRGKKVIFLTASNSYFELVKKTLVDSTSCLALPFPLNIAQFNYSKVRAKEFRTKYNFKRNEIVILYTGRITQQKNVHLLIESVQKINRTGGFKNKVKLIIFGNVDEFETSTFFEKSIIPGSYFHQLNNLLKNDVNVQICARTGHNDLIAAYSGSDLFISLSLYHDEDFGFSPIESLCVGTKVLLTYWGGYRDLKTANNIQKKYVSFANVEFKENYLEINDLKLKQLIKSVLNRKRIDSKSIKTIKDKYSIKSMAKNYSNVLNLKASNFEGFHDNFSKLALSLVTTSNPPLDDYEYFYDSFWKKNEI